MNSSIENDRLKIISSTKGAELQSIKGQHSDLEYLWQGNAEHWGRRSPVLFPVVGKLKDNSYSFEGATYTLGQHGFARDMEFELVESSAHHLMYHLKANEESRKVYPFDFELSITYTLKGHQLTVSYMIENPSDENLFFSIGAHPAFNCPMREGEKRSDYHLQFGGREVLERQLLMEGLRTGDRVPVLTGEKILPVTDRLFDEDALIFEGFESGEIAICRGDTPYVTVIFDEFEYLGIWSKSDKSPFICIEPWLGIADHMHHNGEIREKEGIIELASREVFTAQYHLVFKEE